MSPSMPPEDILLEPYCIFCRGEVPVRKNVAPEFATDQPEDVLCYGDFRLQRFMLRLESPLDPDPHSRMPEAIKKCLEASNKQLCLDCHRRRYLGSNAHLVHIPCLQLAHIRLPRLCIRTLCRIGQILRPVVGWRDSVRLFGRQPMSSFLSQCSLRPTELGAVIQQIQQRLSIEIQMMVCEFLPEGLFSSLATCSETVRWLVEQEFADFTALGPCLAPKSPLTSVHDVEALAASVRDVLGESYLAGLQASPLQGAQNYQIQLSRQDVLGLHVLLGRYGVVGTRVRYQDGSVSPWLGQSVSKWGYFIRGHDLKRLQVQSDVRQLTHLHLSRIL
ncbi:unnamed protein product [Clonostachys solani]|uniref:Uncharacterized protein n=1 Tax=Clonostachys solani TaxID=160281 RepID=A0A9N9ZEG9_9HYPO|nr:unnamed protein product [Clonostachys solani]